MYVKYAWPIVYLHYIEFTTSSVYAKLLTYNSLIPGAAIFC